MTPFEQLDWPGGTKHRAQRWALFACIAAWLAIFAACGAGCAKKEPPMLTGKVVSAWEILVTFPDARLPDASYAVVNSAWLAWYQEQFEQAMFDLGNPMKWEARSDCNRFAHKFAADAQARYMPTNFHSRVPAQALAIGEVWGRTPTGELHAINVALTERGWVWWEPQRTPKHETAPLTKITFSRF